MVAYGLIIDPKGERSHWEKQLIVLRGLISTVTLGAVSSDRGKLDPYNIYPDDIREAHELTLNVLSDLFGLDPKVMSILLYWRPRRGWRKVMGRTVC